MPILVLETLDGSAVRILYFLEATTLRFASNDTNKLTFAISQPVKSSFLVWSLIICKYFHKDS